MTQKEFSERIDMSPSHLNEIIKGKRPITKSIARKLEQGLGIPSWYWMKMQIDSQSGENFSTDVDLFTIVQQYCRKGADAILAESHDEHADPLYMQSSRQYEDEICLGASLEDLDEEFVGEFKERIGASHMDTDKMLYSRGLMVKKDNTLCLTNAAVILFSEASYLFPQNIIRFIRYEGGERKFGTEMNLIKDREWRGPLIQSIRKAQDFVSTQVKELTTLCSGELLQTFMTVPEYPEFTWKEAIVNAASHRLWSARGDYIRISMFDDRIEVFSPGLLPDVVTVDNMRCTRYARNPRICDVLGVFGLAKRLNEGVDRIYREMESAGLPSPEFTETDSGLILTLRNGASSKGVS